MKYFTINELCNSITAKRNNIDNTPTDEIKLNLESLVSMILDPLRESFGKPLFISSGYRCPKLNKKVGGVSNSQHIKGEAADIDLGSIEENKILFDLIIELKLPFDQLIWENNGAWVHVSYSRIKNRKQILKISK